MIPTRAYMFLAVFLWLFTAAVSSSGQPTAASDFFIVDKPQYLETNKNDENFAGHAFSVPTWPNHGSVTWNNWDPFACMTCPYFTPVPTYTGFDSFQYQYVVCCGNPPGPSSNIADVYLLLIGSDDAQNAGASCKASVGQPINVTNGNMWLEQQDYWLPGIGESIEIKRFYNSIIQTSGLFGRGWSTKYDEALIIYADDKMLRLNGPDGRAFYFGRANTANPFTSFSPDLHGQIIKNGDGSYTLTYKDGRVHRFDSFGRLLWLKDRNGNQTTLNYTRNLLTGITDGARTLTILLNPNGYISQLTDTMGTVATYGYNEDDPHRLQTATFPDGSTYNFEYTTISNKIYLTTVTDAQGNILEHHEYDQQGRATTSVRQGGQELYELEYTHDILNNPVTIVTDGLGRDTKYFHNRSYGTNLITKVQGMCCGGAGSEVTQYVYDVSNSWLNLVKKVDALGRESLYTYDGNRNLVSLEEKIGSTSLGTETFTHNLFGQVLTHTDSMNGVTTNTYDANGNLLTTKDPLNNVTTVEYPATNNKGLPTQIKDARNNITKFKWFTGSGLLQEVEDPYGKKTNFTYDARGRTNTITNPLGDVTDYNYFDDTQRKVEMIYPNLDKITYKYDVRRLLESVTDERGKITGYEFDPQYRLKKITDPLGHAREFGYNSMSFMTSSKDGLGNITTYVPDAFDRLKEIEYPAPTVGAPRLKEKFEYDKVGRIKKVIDTANRDTVYAYDDTNRKITVTNAELESTELKYNARFQNIEVKDGLNQVYAFTYDPLNRMLTQSRAGGTMSFEYDAVGNRTKRTDFIGRVTNYEYDFLNRLKKIKYGDPVTPGTPIAENTYNYDDISRLTSAVNGSGTVSFAYDNRNRVTSTTDVFNRVVAYEYERTSTVNQKRLKLDSALYATYNFDNAERLSNIVNASDSTTISFGYDNADRMTSRVYPNGVTTTYEYDDMSRLKRLKDVNTSTTLFDRQYQYNTANQISQITEPSLTRIFGYDNVNRLTSVSNGGSGESYTYDDVGNRTSSHLASSYGYQSGPFNHLVSAVTPSQTLTYGYDANGNMTRKAEGSNLWSYSWDYNNRLTEAAARKTKVRYRYDALGRRVQRYTVGNAENTKFTYDGQDVLVDDNSGTLTKYLNGEGIDNKLRQTIGSTPSYFLVDHLGSTNGLANSSGSLTASNSYDSFGNATNVSFPSRYQFTGREYESVNKLHYYRARYYDSKVGRFVSEDPIGFGGGDSNLYGYVWNNPAVLSDPSGLFPFGSYGNATPGDLADWWDERIGVARNYWGVNPPIGIGPTGDPMRFWDWLSGFGDPLRVGRGLGCAMYAEGLQDYQRFDLVAADVARGGEVFLAMAAPLAGRFSGTRPPPQAYARSRPHYAKGQVEDVWQRAKDSNGRVYDPHSGEELFWDRSLPRRGQWDMGHLDDMQYRDYHRRYTNGEMSLDEFKRIHRDPSNYRPQSIRTNRGWRNR